GRRTSGPPLSPYTTLFRSRPVTAELGTSELGTVRPERAVQVCPTPHETSDDDARSSVSAFAPRVSRDDDGELWAVSIRPAPEERSEEHTSELQSRFELVCR